MLHFKKSILAAMTLVFLLAGCASDDEVAEFNKPALYWYKKIGKSVINGNMDKADAYYISLKSEHMRSPLMQTSIMILAAAHMNNEKYLLSNYYLDEYNKRFSHPNSHEYVEFMKLKASFLGVKDVYKDQKHIMDGIDKANTFISRYPGSDYAPLVNTILIRLHMSHYMLNENIAALYERTDKPEAAKIYRDKNKDDILELSDIAPPEQGIIGMVFD